MQSHLLPERGDRQPRSDQQLMEKLAKYRQGERRYDTRTEHRSYRFR